MWHKVRMKARDCTDGVQYGVESRSTAVMTPSCASKNHTVCAAETQAWYICFIRVRDEEANIWKENLEFSTQMTEGKPRGEGAPHWQLIQLARID